MNRTRWLLCLALLLLGACRQTPNDIGLDVGSDSARDMPQPDVVTDTSAPVEGGWTLVAEDHAPGALFSGWAGADETWFVGGELAKPLALRYDGAAWQSLDPGTGQQLWWVHGFDDGPVFVVGDGGVTARYEDGNWEQLPTGMPGVTLYGVWGATPDDVWAVGGPYAMAESGPPSQGPMEPEDRKTDVLLHFDGFAWTQVVLPALPERSAAAQSLFKVWGTSSDDVFVVGGGRLILHYDGDEWAVQDAGEGSQQLFTVTGRASDDVWAVGGGATSVLLHYDGSAWAEVALPPFTPQVLQGLWTAPGQPVHISGYGGFVAELAGETWTVADLFTTNPLHGLVGDSEGGLWAAGGNIMVLSTDYRGTLAVRGRSVPPLPALTPMTPDVLQPEDTDAGPEPEVTPMTDTEDVTVTPDTEDVVPGPVPCGSPLMSCPESVYDIFPGGPCDGELACDYEVYEDWEYWYFSCVEGLWVMSSECLGEGGACGIPPPAEACLDPYASGMVGADFGMGPIASGEAFAPFEDGEQVSITWGGQGSPMLEFRLKLDGIETIECVTYQITAELSAGTNAETAGTVKLRCGESLGMYLVLPLEFIDCDTSLFDLHIELSVEGFGTRSYDLQFMGGGGCWG